MAEAGQMEIKVLLRAVDNLSTTLSALDTRLKKLDTTLQKVNQNAGRAGRKTKQEFEKAKDQIDKSTKSAQRFEQTLWVIGIAITAVGVGVSKLGNMLESTFKQAVGTAGDFQYEMSKVRSVTDFVGASFDDLANKAQQLGRDTEFTAVQVASGLKELGQAGFNAGEQIAAIGPIIDVAAATGMQDLAQATDIVSTTVRGFGLAAEDTTHVVDILAQVAQKTNAELIGIAESMKYIAPVARTAGVSLEETAAMLGVLADQGIKGSQAGTALRRSFLRLIDPPKEAAQAMERLGVTFEANADGSRDATQVFRQLAESEASLADITQIFGVYAASSAAALTNSVPLIEKYHDATNNADGALKEMVTILRDNFTTAIKKARSAIEGLKIAMGTPFLGVLQKVIEAFATVTSVIGGFMKQHQLLAGIITGIVAIFGAFAIAVGAIVVALGSLLVIIPPIIKGYKELNVELSNHVGRLAAAKNATDAEVLALQRLANGMKLTTKLVETGRYAWGKYGSRLKSIAGNAAVVGSSLLLFSGALDRVDGALGTTIELSALLIPNLFLLGAKFGLIGLAIAGVISAVLLLIKYWDQLSAAITRVENSIRGFFGIAPRKPKFVEELISDFAEVDDAIHDLAKGYVESFDDISVAFSKFVGDFERRWGKIPDSVKREMADAFNAVLEEERRISQAVAGMEEFDLKAIEQAFGPVKENYKQAMQEMSEDTLQVKESVREVEQGWKEFEATITDRTPISAINDKYNEFIDSIVNGFESVKVSVSEDLEEINEKLKNLPKSKEDLKDLEEYIKHIGKTGKEQFGAWLSAAENALSGIRGRLVQIQQELTNLATNTENTIRGIYAQGEQTLRQIRRKGLDKAQLEAESKQFIRETAERARLLAQEGGEEGDTRKLEEARDLYKQIEQEAGKIKDITFAYDAAQLSINSRAGIAASLEETKKQKLEEEKRILEEQEQKYADLIAAIKELIANLSQTIKLDVDATKLKEDIKGPHEAKIAADTTGLRGQVSAALQEPFPITVVPKKGGGGVGDLLTGVGDTMMAGGGKLSGYGGGDRVPALLEAGEFVIRKEAVRKYGAGLFSALNALQGRIAKVATGGLIPGFQSGGFFADMSLDAIKKRLELFDQYAKKVVENFNQPRLAPGDLGYGNAQYAAAATQGLYNARASAFGGAFQYGIEEQTQGVADMMQSQGVNADVTGTQEDEKEPIEIKITVNTDGGGQISGSVKRY